MKTFTIVIPTFTHGSQTLWNLQMAFSLIAMLPPLVLFIVLRRYMVRGLSSWRGQGLIPLRLEDPARGVELPTVSRVRGCKVS